MAGCILGTLICSIFGLVVVSDTATLHYEMRLSASIDGTPVQASAVQQITFRREQGLPNVNGINSDIVGQAVVLAVGDRAAVAVLFGEGEGAGLFAQDLMTRCGVFQPRQSSDQWMANLHNFGGECTLKPDQPWTPSSSVDHADPKHFPFIVSFDDARDPKSINWLDPTKIATVGGHMVKIEQIDVRSTFVMPTFSIVAHFPWINPTGQFDNLYGDRIGTKPPNGIYLLRADFLMGDTR